MPKTYGMIILTNLSLSNSFIVLRSYANRKAIPETTNNIGILHIFMNPIGAYMLRDSLLVIKPIEFPHGMNEQDAW